MIHTRTKVGIEKAKADGVKFGRTIGSRGSKSDYKAERIKIFLMARAFLCTYLAYSAGLLSSLLEKQ